MGSPLRGSVRIQVCYSLPQKHFGRLLLRQLPADSDDDAAGQLLALTRLFHRLASHMQDMAVFEEKMNEIAGDGQQLLGRLRGGPAVDVAV